MGGKAALVIVLGFAFVLTYVSQNLGSASKKAVGNVSLYASASESHNLAVTAANVALAKFYQDTTWRGTATQTFPTGGVLRGGFTYATVNMPGGNLKLRSFTSVPVLLGTGAQGMLHDTVEVILDRNTTQSFTIFAWMTNSENGVYWITGDTVWGRVHSNGKIYVNGSPVYWEKVTTASTFSERPGRGANQGIYKNGYETGIAPITLPNDISMVVNAATSGGRNYIGNITVTLYPGTSADNDGYVIVVAGAARDTIQLNDAGFNGTLLGTGRVTVSGTLDGRLTIGSLNDVYIVDNILYENSSIPATNDMLGLVADDDVIVADNAANRTNCEIHGSIFARTGSFTAENYSSGSPRGTLRVLGSIVQDDRGAVGTFSHGEIQTGYLKRYRYDTRLSDNDVRPPSYPGFYRKTYKIAGWWENVRAPAWWD